MSEKSAEGLCLCFVSWAWLFGQFGQFVVCVVLLAPPSSPGRPCCRTARLSNPGPPTRLRRLRPRSRRLQPRRPAAAASIVVAHVVLRRVAVRQRDLRKRNERDSGRIDQNIPMHQRLLSPGDPSRACRLHLSCKGPSGSRLEAIESGKYAGGQLRVKQQLNHGDTAANCPCERGYAVS